MADDKVKEEKKETKEASKGVEKLVEDISKLSVLELSQLVTTLQDKLGVSAIPTAAAPAAGGTPTAEAGQSTATETGGGNLTMTGSGANKIAVIKALREINQNLTLMDAKNMTEQVPAEVIKDGKAEEVKEAAEKLKAAGATFEIK